MGSDHGSNEQMANIWAVVVRSGAAQESLKIMGCILDDLRTTTQKVLGDGGGGIVCVLVNYRLCCDTEEKMEEGEYRLHCLFRRVS